MNNAEEMREKAAQVADRQADIVRSQEGKTVARYIAKNIRSLSLPESTEPGWISVEERLPPPMEGSLMSEEYLVGCGPSGDYDYFVARYNHNRKCWDDGDYQDDIPGVTHWRELPSPPAKPESKEKP